MSLSTVPLVVEGGLFTLGGTDFSDAVASVTLHVDANEVTIPATLATPQSARTGARKYSIEVKYLANDTSLTTEMFMVIWTAITTGTGELAFEAQLRAGAASASNPKWTGTIVHTAAAVGGDVGGISEDSQTWTLKAMPIRATS